MTLCLDRLKASRLLTENQTCPYRTSHAFTTRASTTKTVFLPSHRLPREILGHWRSPSHLSTESRVHVRHRERALAHQGDSKRNTSLNRWIPMLDQSHLVRKVYPIWLLFMYVSKCCCEIRHIEPTVTNDPFSDSLTVDVACHTNTAGVNDSGSTSLAVGIRRYIKVCCRDLCDICNKRRFSRGAVDGRK